MFESLLAGLTALRPFAWRTAFAFMVFCLILLFLPSGIVTELGLTSLLSEGRPILAILLFLSVAIISVELFELGKHYLGNWIREYTFRRNGERQLQKLSSDEKNALRRYLDDDVSTQHFSMSQGIAQVLSNKGLVYRSSNVGLANGKDHFPYSIQPIVLDILRRNPELLD